VVFFSPSEWNVISKARKVTQRRSYYPPPTRDKGTFKRQERKIYNIDHFMPLNKRPERIYREVYQSRIIPNPPKPRTDHMGTDPEAWCKYHRIRGHTTDNCWQLKKEIEKLIQDGKLKRYVRVERGEDHRRPAEEKRKENHKEDSKERHILHAILRGFA